MFSFQIFHYFYALRQKRRFFLQLKCLKFEEDEMIDNECFLSIIKKQFPTIEAAITEIINLEAIRNLPKGTEHFVSDIHGEYKAFDHILRTASGVVRRKVEETFGENLTEEEKNEISLLISYPEDKLEYNKNKIDTNYLKEKICQLIAVCKVVSSKYTRSKVRKSLPAEFAYIIEELLHEQSSNPYKKSYNESIINAIIENGEAESYIIAIANTIRKLIIDRLHILGDIFDRGPGADIILDRLLTYQNIDFVWGNHDILWIGAAAGSEACIANCIRISLRYGHIDMLREGYGIDISPLATLAYEKYSNDDPKNFYPKVEKEDFSEKEFRLITLMHKAISVIEFKLEAQLLKRNPDYKMDDRILLDRIDFQKGVFYDNGNEYKLNDRFFPTIDLQNPFLLDNLEQDAVTKLVASFKNSEKLQKHAKFLLEKGSLYLTYNNNLLFHGCIPMESDGSFQKFEFDCTNKVKLSGREFLDWLDDKVRASFYNEDGRCKDIFWFLWSGKDSPLFGKKKMTTFERYFLEEKELHNEEKNAYYSLRDDPLVIEKICQEFNINNGIVINGHMPVKVKKGENPIKAEGRLLVIDGGMAKAYQKETGIAGYTLIYSSKGLFLAEHAPYLDSKIIIEKDMDLVPNRITVKDFKEPILIKNTDIGKELKMQIDALKQLIEFYKKSVRL